MRKLLLAAVVLLPASALATTIIAIRTPDVLILATDSKVTYRGNPGPPTACKIFRSGALYFAVAGLDSDAATGFAVKSIVGENVFSTGTFAEQVARIEHAVSQALLPELDRLRAKDPTNYDLMVHDGREIVSIVFVQWDAGTPRLAARGFIWHVNPAPSISVDRLDCPGDCSDGREMVFLGEKTAAAKFMKGIEGEDFDLPSLATKLVYLEIQNSPFDVGPPVTELRLDKDGPQWLANETGCPVNAP